MIVYDIKIDNVTVQIGEGASVTDVLDETLDSGLMLIPFSTKESVYPIGARVDITVNGTTLSYKIESDNVEIVSEGDPIIYEHTLTLIELSKFLERKMDGTRTFTKGITPLSTNVNMEYTSPGTNLSTNVESIIRSDVRYNLTVTGPLSDSIQVSPAVFRLPPGEYVIPIIYNINNINTSWSIDVDFNVRTADPSGQPIGSLIRNVDIGSVPPSGNISGTAFASFILSSERDVVFTYETTSEAVGNYYQPLDFDFSFSTSETLFTQSLLDIIDSLRLTAEINFEKFAESEALFTIDPALETILDKIEAPQFFINRPNHKEAIDQVLKYVNAISRIKVGNVLSADFFNELANELTTNDLSTLLDKTRKHDITNYATAFESTITNTLNEGDKGGSTIVYPDESNFISLRVEPGSDSVILGSDNGVFVLPEPINNTVKVTALVSGGGFPIGGGDEISFANLELDVTRNVVESDLYKILDEDASQVIETDILYKSTVLRFTKDDILVKGAGDVSGVFSLNQNFINMLKNALFTQEKLFNATITGVGGDFKQWYLRIEYVPSVDRRIQVERKDISEVNIQSEIETNQRDNIISLTNYANNLYGTAQRLGNSEITFHHFVTDLSQALNIGDYTTDLFIITKREFIFYTDYIIVKYELNKNFNRIASFIGIDSQVRQYEVPKSGEALDRHLLYKEYVHVGFTPLTDDNDDDMFLKDEGLNVLLDTFNDVPSAVVKNALVTPDAQGFTDEPGFDKIGRSLDSSGGGDSLRFSFDFETNVKVADQIVSKNSRLVNNPVKYTSDDGRLERMKMTYVDTIEKSSFVQLQTDTRIYPLVFDGKIDNSKILFDTPDWFLILKDSSERLIWNSQVQIVPYSDIETKELIVGRFFTERNDLVNQIDTGELYLWTSDTEYYNEFDTIAAKGSNTDEVISITRGTRVLSVNAAETTGKKSWAIADGNGNLYMAVNQRFGERNELYFSRNRKRNGIIKIKDKL